MSRDFQGGRSSRGKTAGRTVRREQPSAGEKRVLRTSGEGGRRRGSSFLRGEGNRPGAESRVPQGSYPDGERRGAGFRTSATGSRIQAPGPARRRTLGEERAAAGRTTPLPRQGTEKGGKKLLLRRERRPSRKQLIRELGYTSDKKENLRTPEKGELIRLNRFISNAGICSRREADKYIAAGVVTVNGQTVTELGTKVSPDDEVRFDNRLLTPERKVYVLLNKPRDVVTTTDDPHAEHTVMELVKGACDERIYPVGRLDRNTTGLLLLTNDGDLSKKLTHPSHKVEKVYQVTLDKTVSVNDMKKIADGIELEDGFIAADGITFVEGQEKDTIGIEIHSGRNRIVRRIFESLGYRVKALDRVSFAGLTKKNLPRGKWRLLTPREVSYLKMK